MKKLWCEGKISVNKMCDKVANLYKLKPNNY